MRNLLALFFTYLLATSASAQVGPYHTFQYKVSKAHYAKDDQTIPNRLLLDGRVSGDMMISNCTKHKKYISGIRISFINGTENATKREMFSLECNKRTKSLFISRVRRIRNDKGEYIDVIDREKKLNSHFGTRIPSSISFQNNTVFFTIEGKTFTQKLDFKVHKIELIGVGSSGIARFFEEDLNS